MLLDASLALVPIGAPLSLVGGLGATFYSAVLDLLGQGVGTPPANVIGNATTFGTDFGIGDDRLLLECAIGTALATSDAATLSVQWQFAADQGAAGNYQPSTWYAVIAQDGITAAQGTANARIARFDWPAAFPENLQPRYTRLAFVTPAATQFTGGTIAFAVLTPERDDYSVKYAAKGYVVS